MNIGVLSVETERSVKDKQLLANFSCNRVNNITNFLANDVGVLGTNNPRTTMDMKSMSSSSCNKEGYLPPSMMGVGSENYGCYGCGCNR